MNGKGDNLRDSNSPDSLISSFLAARSDIFRSLSELRDEGWKNSEGDKYFQRQREAADNAGWNLRKVFLKTMEKIGDEIQSAIGALKLSDPQPEVLDLCMAPGGYTASALKYNPHAHVSAVTLPASSGGHIVMVPTGSKDRRVNVWYTDITMLVTEFGVTDVPNDHPDQASFRIGKRPYANLSFDLVFCDGQVLRTHAKHRSEYRERNEATRLACSQLIIAMQRIKPGGTLIMLLHKVDEWHTLTLLHTFDKIADIQLFKPTTAHERRSSFYLIARNVQPKHAEALRAITRWKDAWKAATFPEQGIADAVQLPLLGTKDVPAEDVSALLSTFGDKLVDLADPIWRIQRDALAKAPWLRKQEKKNDA